MKKAMACAGLLLAGILGAAENSPSTNLNDVALWEKNRHLTCTADGSFQIQTPTMVQLKELFPVNPDATYCFTGEIKKSKDAPSARFLAGFLLYDKDKKVIDMVHVNVIRGTLTALAEPVKAGDSVIKIENGGRWTANTAYHAAFNAGPLPNRDISAGAIAAVKREGTSWSVSLNKPLQKNYPKGTKVQIQCHGGYFYSAIETPSDQWKRFGKTIKGVSRNSIEATQFWPGTAYMKPMMMPNWDWQNPDMKNLKTDIRNLKLETSGTVK